MRVGAAGRVLTAVVTVAAAGGTGAALSEVSPPATGGPPAQRLPLALATPALACPGPETRLVPAGAEPADPGGPVTIAVMAADPTGTANAGTRLRVRPLAPPEGDAAVTAADGDLAGGLDLRVGAGGVVGGLLTATRAGAAVVESPVTAAAPPPLLAGVQATVTPRGDLRGLATTSCTAAASDTWLVGGATTTGHRLRLLLANTAATPAVVEIAVHGPGGRVDTPAGESVTVPPRESRALFVDALAPDLDRVAVHVSARSGRVQATLHSSVLRGLTPGGTDDVPPAARPSRRLVVPGIAIAAGSGEGSNGEDGEGDEDGEGGGGGGGGDGGGRRPPVTATPGASAVRIAVPGTEEAVAGIRLIGPEGEVRLTGPRAVNVPAGGVVDVPIEDVPAAVYSAVVTSDVPVVAGALVGRGDGDGPAEFAWSAAARPLTAGRLLTTVPATTNYLALAAAGHSGQVMLREVFPGGRLGAERTLDVHTGQSPGMGVSADAVGLLVTDVVRGPVTGALVQSIGTPEGQLLSIRPLSPPAITSRPRPRAIQDPTLGLPGTRRTTPGDDG